MYQHLAVFSWQFHYDSRTINCTTRCIRVFINRYSSNGHTVRSRRKCRIPHFSVWRVLQLQNVCEILIKQNASTLSLQFCIRCSSCGRVSSIHRIVCQLGPRFDTQETQVPSKVRKFPHYMASHSRRQYSSTLITFICNISRCNIHCTF